MLWKRTLEDGLTLVGRDLDEQHERPRWPRMRKRMLVVEITDGDAYCARGHVFQDQIEKSVIQVACALSQERASTPWL